MDYERKEIAIFVVPKALQQNESDDTLIPASQYFLVKNEYQLDKLV